MSDVSEVLSAIERGGRDAAERLEVLDRDVASTKARIRHALDELADQLGIARRDVTHGVRGYLDDLLSDVVFNVRRDLEREIEGETDLL